MQTSLSILNGLYQIREERQLPGEVRVPWEVAGYAEDFAAAEAQGGWFDLTHWGTIEIAGPDARDYLQRMTTVNFKTLDASRVHPGAFLTGKAQLIALGYFQVVPSGFLYLVPGHLTAPTIEHIEKFHFAEKLTVTDRSADNALFGLWNPPKALLETLGISPDLEPWVVESRVWMSMSMDLWRDGRRPSLFWIRTPHRDGTILAREWRHVGMPLLGQHLFEYYRVKSGLAAVGIEATERDLILEANLEDAVARNKGCYPGQEVVERIFTYGQVNRKLCPVAIEFVPPTTLPQTPLDLTVDGKNVGILVSYQIVPNRPMRAVGLAYVHKDHWERREPFTVSLPGITVLLGGEKS